MTEGHAHATSGFLPWIEIGDLRIQTYFVVISLVLSVAAFFTFKRAEKIMTSTTGSSVIQPKDAMDIFIAAMIGGFVGSRLLHVLWEEPSYYTEDWFRIFDVMSGGFVWFGGAIGGLLSIVAVVCLKTEKTAIKTTLLRWLDFFSPVAAFGYAGGRVACWLTGCCYGRVCDWPDFLSGGGASFAFRFPTQAWAVFWELGLGFFLLRLESRTALHLRSPGRIFFFWLTLHGLGRVLMELLRADPRGPAAGNVTISLVLSGLALLCGLYGLKRTSKK